jgi:hypothetical protein
LEEGLACFLHAKLACYSAYATWNFGGGQSPNGQLLCCLTSRPPPRQALGYLRQLGAAHCTRLKHSAVTPDLHLLPW